MRFYLVALPLALALFSGALRAQDTDAMLDAAIKQFVAATKAEDTDKITDMTYSPVVEWMGGSDKAKAAARESKQKRDERAEHIVSLEVIPPYRRIGTIKNNYVLIPLHMIEWIGMHKYEMYTSMLAIKSPSGGKWEFMESSKMPPEVRDRFFADLKDKDLPAPRFRRLF